MATSPKPITISHSPETIPNTLAMLASERNKKKPARADLAKMAVKAKAAAGTARKRKTG